MREQDWRANYHEALRERNEAERKVERVRAIVNGFEAGDLWSSQAIERVRDALGDIP